MKLSTKIATIAATAALVAAPAIAVAGPAQAAPAVAKSGTMLISFKKEDAGILKLIKPVAPAKYIQSKFTFPVVSANKAGTVVKSTGGMKFGNTPYTNPVITINVAKKTATISMTFEGGSVQIFTLKHFKNKADGVDGTVWQGDARLTTNKVTVATINESLGVDSLTPGMGIGQIRVTVKNA